MNDHLTYIHVAIEDDKKACSYCYSIMVAFLLLHAWFESKHDSSSEVSGRLDSMISENGILFNISCAKMPDSVMTLKTTC